MKNPIRRSVLPVLLVVSLAANLWLGTAAARDAGRVREGAAYLTWGAVYALNGLVEAIEDPQADWNSLRFQARLLQLCEWATLYSQSAASTMGGLLTGPYHDVAVQFNELGFRMTDYRSLIHQALTTGQFPETSRTKLQGLAANLRTAGWPQQSFSRDNAADWGNLAADLKRFLELDALPK